MATKKIYFTSGTIARCLGISMMTVSMWRRNRDIPNIQIKGFGTERNPSVYGYDLDEVAAWAKKNNIKFDRSAV